MPTVRIAIAAPSALVRAGIADGLVAEGDFEVVRAAATLAELAEAGYGGAEIVVVDVGAGGETELDAFAGSGPQAIVLATARRRARRRMADRRLLGAAARRSAAGDRRCGARRARRARRDLAGVRRRGAALRARRRAAQRRAGFDALTPRERQVLAAMSNGLGNREIGSVLGISAHTAKFHVAQIIAKLQAQSRAHAVAKALRAGFVDA